MKKNTFPKRLRLLSNEEFKAVISKKNRFADDVLVIYYSQNTREFSRLGITIGKSAGGAVERNRFKRLAGSFSSESPAIANRVRLCDNESKEC